MKVIKWVNWESVEKSEKTHVEMGGFFEDGMRWKDFIDRYDEAGVKYFNALRESILERGIRITGDEHQHGGGKYVPVFDDGWTIGFSFRAWGDLMAAIYSEKENKDYSYMDFYM